MMLNFTLRKSNPELMRQDAIKLLWPMFDGFYDYPELDRMVSLSHDLLSFTDGSTVYAVHIGCDFINMSHEQAFFDVLKPAVFDLMRIIHDARAVEVSRQAGIQAPEKRGKGRPSRVPAQDGLPRQSGDPV